MDRRRYSRHPRTIQDFVRAGVLRPVQPTSALGWTRYPAGREFLPAATNLCVDPQGVLADDTFWPADDATIDTTANTAVPVAVPDNPTVTKCVKYVSDGTAANISTGNITVVASTSYNTSFYVYAPTVGGDITITAETGSSHALATITAANSGFVRYSAATNTGVGQVTLNIKVAFAGAGASTIYITGAKVVAEVGATPFFDGTCSNCAWTGTAHASTSTRTGSSLLFPSTLISSVGTYACSFAPLQAGDSGATYYNLLCMNLAGDETGIAVYHRWDNKISLAINNTVTAQSAAQSYAAGTRHSVIARWSATGVSDTQDLTFDGTAAAQVTTATGALTTLGANIAYMAASCGSGSNAIISPSRLTDAETAALSAMLTAGAGAPELVRFFLNRGYANTHFLPLVGHSVAYKLVR